MAFCTEFENQQEQREIEGVIWPTSPLAADADSDKHER